ncbi:MAG TPA: RNA polymerase sigma factor [Rhodanobacteraceae bacterium]
MAMVPETSAVADPIGPATSDRELAERAAHGDGTAFEAIMRRHNRQLFRTARSILKSDAGAEDAVQEAYLHAWRALGKFHADAKLSTWLVRIVINEALARLHRKHPATVPLESVMTAPDPVTQTALAADTAALPDRVAMRGQLRKLLEARIDLLPDAFRSVFMLRAVEEMSVQEVSAALDIPEATVRTRFFRARSMLRESLANDIDVELADAFSFDGDRCDHMVITVLALAQAEGLARPWHFQGRWCAGPCACESHGTV